MEQILAMGAAQAWQQLSIIQADLSRVFGTPRMSQRQQRQRQVPEGQPATGGAEGQMDEEQWKPANRTGGRNDWFPAASVV